MPAALPPTLATPLGVGLIGFGYAGATLHAPLITTTPGLALAVVASSKPAAVQAALGNQVQVLADPLALLEHPAVQVVVIASPNDSHARLADAALRAGRHVVVDKPFALDADQAAPLLPLAADRGLQLAVFHNRRWDGDVLTARALLAGSTLGRVHQASLHIDRWRPQVRNRWRESAAPGAGLWLDLGSHLLDQALGLFGWPHALSADIRCLRPGGLSDDAFDCRLTYADGLRVDIGASMLAAEPRMRMALHGSRGSWLRQGLDGQEDALKAGQRPDPSRPEAWGQPTGDSRLVLSADGLADPVPLPHPMQPGQWPAFYARLRDALCGLGPSPVAPSQALDVMRLLDLGRASAARHCRLATPAPGATPWPAVVAASPC